MYMPSIGRHVFNNLTFHLLATRLTSPPPPRPLSTFSYYLLILFFFSFTQFSNALHVQQVKTFCLFAYFCTFLSHILFLWKYENFVMLHAIVEVVRSDWFSLRFISWKTKILAIRALLSARRIISLVRPKAGWGLIISLFSLLTVKLASKHVVKGKECSVDISTQCPQNIDQIEKHTPPGILLTGHLIWLLGAR